MRLFLQLVVGTIAVMLAAYLLPGVTVDTFLSAFAVAVVLGILNTILKPILLILTLPINLITLGLFTFVINALIVLLASALAPGFEVGSFGWALLFSFVLTVVTWFLSGITREHGMQAQ